jgi:hypothetical protein
MKSDTIVLLVAILALASAEGFYTTYDTDKYQAPQTFSALEQKLGEFSTSQID